MNNRINPRNHSELPQFLTVAEVAELLRLKPRTIYEMVSERRIPYRKAGDRTIFLLDEILKWTNTDNED
jgi:excisionase family DNA binding protein